MEALKRILVFIPFICLSFTSTFAQPKIILKLDDLTARNGTCKFLPVMDYLKEKKVKAGLGAIGNGFDNSSLGVLQPYLDACNEDSEKLFEIWHHGWDHIEPEFKGTTYTYQKAHFDQTNTAILNYLGIQMQTFGPPFNKSDDITYKVVSENPNYEVFLFTSATIPEVTSLQNRVDMENGVGNPDFNFFVTNYNSNSGLPFMILQGHPAMWNAAKMDHFKQITNFLISKGCKFINPYEMAKNECLEETPPQTPSGFIAVATATTQITLNWTETDEYKRSYLLERKQNYGEFKVIAYPYRSVTSYIDNDVEDGNSYSYRIAALNCIGNSLYSEEKEVVLEEDLTQDLPVDTVSASNYLGSYKPANTVDNQLNTYWLIEGQNEWLQLELMNQSTIQRLEISFIKGNEREYEFTIKTSLDGIEWIDAGEFKSSGTSINFEEYNLNETNARYVRYITGVNSVDDRTWLAEIKLRGFNLTSVEENDQSDIFQVIHFHQTRMLKIIINDNSAAIPTISIYNLLGEKIDNERISIGTNIFDTSHYTPGIYLIKLESGLSQRVKKVFIR